jgi:hypothetical protein
MADEAVTDQVVAIIHSTNQKADMVGPPRKTWSSSRFQLYLAHAEIFCDKVLILSDKLGMISADDEVEPYDTNIKYAQPADALRWWGRIKKEIHKLAEAKPKVVILYSGNFERTRIMREFARAGIRNVTYPFGSDVGISERLDLIYDMEPPFDEAKLMAGEYTLPENFGEPKKRGRKPKDRDPEEADTKLPGAGIEWEDEDENDDVTEAE